MLASASQYKYFAGSVVTVSAAAIAAANFLLPAGLVAQRLKSVNCNCALGSHQGPSVAPNAAAHAKSRDCHSIVAAPKTAATRRVCFE
jgi:hypothetical protein